MPERLEVRYRPVEQLIPYARNARTHSDAQVAQIAASIKEFGWTNPVLTDGENGLIAGHGRVLAARKLGMSEVPTIELSHLTPAQRRAYVLADNQLALNAGWDGELLALELGDLKDEGLDLSLLGFPDDDLAALLNFDGAGEATGGVSMSERFMIAPFSVLNGRDGWWQERKNSWLALGLRSELGRADKLVYSVSSQPVATYQAKNAYDEKLGRKSTWQEFAAAHPDAITQSGTSIFDPVLCEIACRWFCPPGGLVLDPFAGGSVRGVVAAMLGRRYVGVDLRAEQVEANRQQWADLGSDEYPAPVWHCGDSRKIVTHAAGVKADFLFSCPPYADLEVYSDDPADLSRMAYPEFLQAYRHIVRESLALLLPDRFACFVVGEVRGPDGGYRNFVADTIAAFVDAGAKFYNEAVLVTQVGSLAIRAGKGFTTSRKLGKTHQNVLVFVKGNPRLATEACGPVEVDKELLAEAGE